MESRAAALQQMKRVLVTHGRLGLSVFSDIERTPAALALSEALDRRVGLDASRPKRSEHSLADKAELRGLVADAGFRNIRITTVVKQLQFPSAADWVRIQLSASPLAAVLNGLAPDRAELVSSAVIADVTSALASYRGEAGISVPQEAHVLLAAA